MVELEQRIRKGREAILKARTEGKDTSKWEAHLGKLEEAQMNQISEFEKRNLAILIPSEVLGCEYWLCSNQQVVDTTKKDASGAICYTADEVMKLFKGQLTTKNLQDIHLVKRMDNNCTILEIKDRAEKSN